ncbi:MAG: YicC/YloC family endoribonuclease [Spongiibacteraceae bacterium]|nr:YicC/YloC family endoribonuclease [Spongiibacteraceae bacterium]
MTHSMTAFARATRELQGGSLTWELRSVNHRYLEITLRLPDNQRHLEGNLRDLMRKRLQRGKVEAALRVQLPDPAAEQLELNEPALARLLSCLQQVEARLARPAAVDPLAVLAWPGILGRPEEQESSSLDSEILALLEQALDQLVAMRAREGAALRDIVESHLTQVEQHVAAVRTALPAIMAEQRARLTERLRELPLEADPARLEQEMVILAHKSDVAEELDRLSTHVQEVRRALADTTPCGRRLDFLMQELNREANTLSSKSLSSETTAHAVALKVLIEQMREQIQNIE